MEHEHMKIYIALGIIITVLLISLLTNKWTVLSNSQQQNTMGINAAESGNMDMGIWQTCGNISANINTPNIPDMPNININNNMRRGININANSCTSNDDSNFTAVKIFSVLGLLLLIAGIVLLHMMPEHHIYSVITIVLGGICSLLAAILWSTNKNLKPDGTNLGYSWYLQLLGSVLGVITGLLIQFNVLQY